MCGPAFAAILFNFKIHSFASVAFSCCCCLFFFFGRAVINHRGCLQSCTGFIVRVKNKIERAVRALSADLQFRNIRNSPASACTKWNFNLFPGRQKMRIHLDVGASIHAFIIYGTNAKTRTSEIISFFFYPFFIRNALQESGDMFVRWQLIWSNSVCQPNGNRAKKKVLIQNNMNYSTGVHRKQRQQHNESKNKKRTINANRRKHFLLHLPTTMTSNKRKFYQMIAIGAIIENSLSRYVWALVVCVMCV